MQVGASMPRPKTPSAAPPGIRTPQKIFIVQREVVDRESECIVNTHFDSAYTCEHQAYAAAFRKQIAEIRHVYDDMDVFYNLLKETKSLKELLKKVIRWMREDLLDESMYEEFNVRERLLVHSEKTGENELLEELKASYCSVNDEEEEDDDDEEEEEEKKPRGSKRRRN